MIKFKEFSFGATSAIITSIAIIIGLSKTINAKINIISALLIIAIADNISDTFGLHIHQESQKDNSKEVKKITIGNFLARLIIIIVFIMFILLFSINLAIILSLLFSLGILIILSYYIAKNQKINPWKSIFHHLILAIVVVLSCFFLREIISNLTLKLID